MDDKIIEKATCAWNSYLNTNDEKRMRLVVYYRKPNTVVEDDKFPLPNIDEVPREQISDCSENNWNNLRDRDKVSFCWRTVFRLLSNSTTENR